MCICLYVYMFICIYVYMFAYIQLCMNIYINIYINIGASYLPHPLKMSFAMTPFNADFAPYENDWAMSPFSSSSLLDWTDPFKTTSLINRPLVRGLMRDVNRMIQRN